MSDASTTDGRIRIDVISIFGDYVDNTLGFIAQGSEFGFGKMYARGINDSALIPGEDKFLHVVSCNTIRRSK